METRALIFCERKVGEKMGFCCCKNCGWSEDIGLLIMCNYSNDRTWYDGCCEAWKPKDVTDDKDMVAVVRCKDCKHRPTQTVPGEEGVTLDFPDAICPCRCIDEYYSWFPKDDWFCGDGKRKEGR